MKTEHNIAIGTPKPGSKSTMVEFNALQSAQKSTIYLNDDNRPQYLGKEDD